MDNLLEQGIAAYKAGNLDEARKIFIAFVKQESDNERAWGWMCMVANNDKEKIHCMEQVLRINPTNEKARQILDSLTGQDFPFELSKTADSINEAQKNNITQIEKSDDKKNRQPNDGMISKSVNQKVILEKTIAYYVRQGYRVVSQTENTVQLIKPKQFSLLVAIILFFIYIIPFVLYLLYYSAQRDKTIYIVVSDEGKISVTNEGGQLRIVDNVEPVAPIVHKPSPVIYKSVSAENDPGYTDSTKIMLAVLAVVIIVIAIVAALNN